MEQDLELDLVLKIKTWMGIWDFLGFSSPAAHSAQAQWFKTEWRSSRHGRYQEKISFSSPGVLRDSQGVNTITARVFTVPFYLGISNMMAVIMQNFP